MKWLRKYLGVLSNPVLMCLLKLFELFSISLMSGKAVDSHPKEDSNKRELQRLSVAILGVSIGRILAVIDAMIVRLIPPGGA